MRTMADVVNDNWFDLDRVPPLGNLLLRSARFRGGMLGMGPITRRIGPAMGRLFLQALGCTAGSIPAHDPLLVYAGHESPSPPLLLVLAEWMEYRRTAPADTWSLLIHTAAYAPRSSTFDLVAMLWEHLQALKRQLAIEQCRVFLRVSCAKPFDEAQCGPRADALLATGDKLGKAAPGESIEMVNKPIVCPRHLAGSCPSARGVYCYPSQRTIMKLPGSHEIDPAAAIEIPEPFAIAGAIRRLTADWACGTFCAQWTSYDADLGDGKAARQPRVKRRPHAESWRGHHRSAST